MSITYQVNAIDERHKTNSSVREAFVKGARCACESLRRLINIVGLFLRQAPVQDGGRARQITWARNTVVVFGRTLLRKSHMGADERA